MLLKYYYNDTCPFLFNRTDSNYTNDNFLNRLCNSTYLINTKYPKMTFTIVLHI